MWATFSLDEARKQLDSAIGNRLHEEPVGQKVDRVRFPVGMLFVRGDRAGPGKEIAEQVVASFGYWNDDSSKYFDVVFPGWGKDGAAVVFDRDAFLRCRAEVEVVSRWRYGGETDLLIVHYDYDPEACQGDFAFDQAAYLPVEQMVRDGRVPNLDALMHELIQEAVATWPRKGEGTVWRITGRMAAHRGRVALWDWIKLRLLRDAGRIYDEVRPFVVVNMTP